MSGYKSKIRSDQRKGSTKDIVGKLKGLFRLGGLGWIARAGVGAPTRTPGATFRHAKA